MKKFKFNFKLTAFLVSLFIGLLLVILAGNNKYCLSFGFILMGLSLSLFVWYDNEKLQKTLNELEEEIDEIQQLEMEELDESFEIESENDEELDEDFDYDAEIERAYVLKQLYARQKSIRKKKQSSVILFNICGIALVILGLFGMF